MEDTNQTPFLNGDVTDNDVQTNGLPPVLVEDDVFDDIMRFLDEVGGLNGLLELLFPGDGPIDALLDEAQIDDGYIAGLPIPPLEDGEFPEIMQLMDEEVGGAYDDLLEIGGATVNNDDLLESFFYDVENDAVVGVPVPFYSNLVYDPVQVVVGFPAYLYSSDGNGSSEDDGNDDLEESASSSSMNPYELSLFIGAKTIACIAYVAALWSIVCLTMVFGVNELGSIRMGMCSSLLLQPNRFFVKTINVDLASENNFGPIIYGFTNKPSFSVVKNWAETHYAPIQHNIQKEWIYFLNEGSEINISHALPGLSTFLLTITYGMIGSDGFPDSYGYCYGYAQCYGDQLSYNNTLSRNTIHGNGVIQQKILQSGEYRISLKKLDSEARELQEHAQLNMSVRSFFYVTNDAFYICMLARSRCVFHVLLSQENHVVLSIPQSKQGTCHGESYVKLSYEPRWVTLFGGIVVINGMILVGMELWKKYGGGLVPWLDDEQDE